MPKIVEMLTSRKFWLTLSGCVAAFTPYLNGVEGYSLQTAVLAAIGLLINYVWQLGKEDAAKITAKTAAKPK